MKRERSRKLQVLECVRGGLTDSSKIAERLGLGEKTVSKYLTNYRRQGLIAEVYRESTGGRGRIVYSLTKKGSGRLDYLKKF